ncbi:LmeA family phospholipid-binding protein [Mycolicibacterium fluoranthenivorans]|uniref:DUF2993 domain-containing protein n=1 Tax=Mycolicibacterium fluoranthenivorans TaxID=258505 RepID=A0A7X5TWP4_9MYCO|nr:DUF2993 domain-containing protein [Mycolicibacterium fluoranthenivorans]MCV7356736.1 DUF2993 domain-containing protein [Mycolicibacterium fluoranthenivorans]NIH94128.1 hypothetical protein [Mycolicibacterium fluoranthenivorans]
MTDPWAPQPTDAAPAGSPAPAGAPVPPPPADPEPKKSLGAKIGGLFRDPLSIVLVVVIVLALVVAGVVGSELVARHIADKTVTQITSCVVQDDVDVSFGKTPVLLQYFTDHYNNITVTTAGHRVREADGMKAEIVINDIRLTGNQSAPGTIGALDANITWTADGIKNTIQNQIPLVGSFVSSVSTHPSDGTIELQAALGSIVVKPEVQNNNLTLTVQSLSGLGFMLPRETVQPALDAFLEQITKNIPLGIHAESVQVTDTGVTAKYVTRNATMPPGRSGSGGDPCFAGLD